MPRVCRAEIPANPDIGGVGVMLSFILIAWFTIILAAWAGFPRGNQSWRTCLRACKKRRHSNTDPRIRKLLSSLSDLQAFTGMAILIAGFSQLTSITHYHRQLVLIYWFFTLNSFFATRPTLVDPTTMNSWPLQARRVIIVISVFSGLVLWISAGYWEKDWHVDVAGLCYRYIGLPKGLVLLAFFLLLWNYFYIAGITLTGLALVLLIAGQNLLLQRIHVWINNDLLRLRSQFQVVDTAPDASHPSPRARQASGTWSRFCRVVATTCYILLRFLLSFVAIWSFGGTESPIVPVIYIVASIWNSYDLLNMKISNLRLVTVDENRMGFGQALALLMLIQVVLSVMDAWRAPRTVQDPVPEPDETPTGDIEMGSLEDGRKDSFQDPERKPIRTKTV